MAMAAKNVSIERIEIATSRSSLNKKKSKSSIFSCGRKQQQKENDAYMISQLKWTNDYKRKRICELEEEVKELRECLKKLAEKVGEKPTILQHCKYVNVGKESVIVGNEDAQKLDQYIEEMKYALEGLKRREEDIQRKGQRSEDALRRAEGKLNVMETHFCALNEKLTRDFGDIGQQLANYNADIADQIQALKSIFQESITRSPVEIQEQEALVIENGVRSIKEWSGLDGNVTAAILPPAAKPLQKLLANKYGKIPAKLEAMLTSEDKEYYVSEDTFDNTVSRWLVGWVRENPDNTARRLHMEMRNLDGLVKDSKQDK